MLRQGGEPRWRRHRDLVVRGLDCSLAARAGCTRHVLCVTNHDQLANVRAESTQRIDVDDESVSHVRGENAFIGIVDLVGGDGW